MQTRVGWFVVFVALGGCDPSPLDRPPASELRFEVDPSWPEAAAPALGEVTGLAVDTDDRVFVFHRAGRGFDNETVITDPTIAIFDGPTGALLSETGAGVFVVPHGLAIDASGHLWATDVGNDTVVELLEDGTVIRVLGGSE